MIHYQTLHINDINLDLFHNFQRYQNVTKCWRKENNQWVIKDDPFIDNWSKEDYKILVKCLKNTIQTNGYACGAFHHNKLIGFVSVESHLYFNKYLDLSSLHVSYDYRHRQIGSTLFHHAKAWAKKQGAQYLYISSHSAIETQAFYQKMGCVEAQMTISHHVKQEPYDCQLECKL